MELFVRIHVRIFVLVIATEAWSGARLFLDDAREDVWSELLPTGIFYGVTTNPLILQKADVPCTIEAVSSLVKRLDAYPVDEVMCQAWGCTAADLERNALALLKACGDRPVVIKLPLTKDGIVAAHSLGRREIRLCMTACYSSHQAVVASALGADYLAPYLGRMTETCGKDGLKECLAMQDAINGMRIPTRLLVASLRDAATVFEVMRAGSDATISADVARSFLHVKETEDAAAEFEIAAASSYS